MNLLSTEAAFVQATCNVYVAKVYREFLLANKKYVSQPIIPSSLNFFCGFQNTIHSLLGSLLPYWPHLVCLLCSFFIVFLTSQCGSAPGLGPYSPLFSNYAHFLSDPSLGFKYYLDASDSKNVFPAPTTPMNASLIPQLTHHLYLNI